MVHGGKSMERGGLNEVKVGKHVGKMAGLDEGVLRKMRGKDAE